MTHLSIDTVVDAVSHSLTDYFSDAITKASTIHPDYARAWKTAATLAQSGGKRLRPYMVCLGYKAYSGSFDQTIIPIATAHELLHLSLLIHDDVIDRDDIRYGVPNITGTYMNRHYATVDESDRRHYAQSAALLVGDGILSGAYQLIVNSECTSDDKITALRLLGEGIFEVCGGELLDTEAAFKPFSSTDAHLIARYKTASYSCISPLVTGAALGGAPKSELVKLRTIAAHLGVAYQLTDDLLGCFGDEAITGKTTLGDIREGKHTFLIEQHLINLGGDDVEKFWAVFGNETATIEQVRSLQQDLITSGAKHRTEVYIDQLAHTAIAATQTLAIPQESINHLLALIEKATKRKF